MAVRPRLLAACAGFSWLAASATASAFCRTHTEDPPASSCPEVCQEQGFPLSWSRPNLTYAFNQRGFPGLSSGQLRGIFNASFQTWQSVRCAARPIGLEIRAQSATTPLELGPEDEEPNTNMIVHLDADDWREQDLPERAFAITAVWFSARDGEILGADMLYNGGMDPYVDCPPDGCAASYDATDLRNVATHEIGHFLGLSHSDVPSSTMWCDADARETVKRSLSDDDVAGICDIYPPGVAFVQTASPTSRACSLEAGMERAPRGPLAAGLLLSLGLLWRRRRRG